MHLAFYLMQNPPNPEQVHKLAVAMMTILPLVILVGLAVVIVPFWFICKKAGFSPWLSLLNIIPFGNLVLIYVLAFAEWKVRPAATAEQMGWPFPPQPPQG